MEESFILYLMRVVDYSRCLYLYVRKDKQILNTCFNPIKDFIYDMQAYKLYNLYIQLSRTPCHVIKTDCILVRTSKDELEKIITFDNKIGGLKYETNKYIIDTKIQMKDNEPVTFNKPKINILTVDEMNIMQMILRKKLMD